MKRIDMKATHFAYLLIVVIALTKLSTWDCLSSDKYPLTAENQQIYFFILSVFTGLGILFYEHVKNITKLKFVAFHIGSIIGLMGYKSFVSATMLGFLLFFISLISQWVYGEFQERKQDKIVH